MGDTGEIWRIGTAKYFSYWHLWWPPRPSWNSSNDISSQTVMRIEPKLDLRHRSNIEIQNCWKLFWSNIWDGPHVAILKIFKPHLLHNGKSDWAKIWWEAFRRHGNLELLNIFCYDFHDGCRSSHLEELLLLALLELMPWSVDHGLSLIRMSVGNFHILDISIRIVSMMAAMAAILKVFSRSRIVSRMERKLGGRHPGSMEI